VSVESQEYLRRFWKVAHWSPVPWISAEPLLGPLEMPNVLDQGPEGGRCKWVVAGGESGSQARPMRPAWVRSIRDQCQAAGVAFFFKQWGEYLPGDDALTLDLWGDHEHVHAGQVMVKVGKKAAGDLLDGRQWQEFPEVKHAPRHE
jgi:protein gp37